jgi:hypothetical protein
MPDTQYQYVKLPNGEYGKFRADATDATIRAAILKDFPDAYGKTEAQKAGAIAREGALGAASGLGIPETEHPISDLLKSSVPNFSDPKWWLQNIAAGPIGGIIASLPKEYQYVKEAAAPLLHTGAASATVPFGAPGTPRTANTLPKHSTITQEDLEQMAHGGGAILSQLLALKEEERAGAGKDAVQGAAREFIGLGKSRVQDIAAERAAEAAGERGDIKEQYGKDVGENLAERKAASAKETTAATKEQVFTKQGPVYQRMTQMADQAQSYVQRLDKQVRQRENAKWEAFRRPLEGVTVDGTPVAAKIAEVEQSILSTQDVPIFKRILDEMEAEGSPVRSTRSSFGAMTVDYLRRLSTKLGERMYTGNVPGDVYRALKQVQGTVEQSIEGVVREAMGPQGVKTYHQLKQDWHQYMETFYDMDSPVRKLKEGLDPNDKLNPVVGDEGQRAINLLSRYRNMGAASTIDTMGRLRALQKAVRELPSGKGTMPEAPTRPSLEVPVRPTDPESIRGDLLKEKVRSYSSPTRWELRFPPLRLEMMAVKRLLESPAIRDWLTKGPL